MVLGLVGKKIGMTRLFMDSGESVGVTVIQAEPNSVLQIKTEEKEGYNAVQLGFENKRANLVNKPVTGHFKKNNCNPKRYIKEFRVSKEETGNYESGQEISIDIFKEGEFVDVTGTSKGKGFAGVMKRHGFGGLKGSHGTHKKNRHPGSIGMCAYPGRVLKGMKMGGRLGNKRVTSQNLKIIKVDTEKNVIMIKGSVPGKNKSMIIIKKSVKK